MTTTFACGHARTEDNIYREPRAVRRGTDPARCRACRSRQKHASTRHRTSRATGKPIVLHGTYTQFSVPDVDTAVQAACGGSDTEMFFARKGEHGIPDRVWNAFYRYCQGCPVAATCAEVATEGRYEGLWGGQWRRSKNYEYTITPLGGDA